MDLLSASPDALLFVFSSVHFFQTFNPVLLRPGSGLWIVVLFRVSWSQRFSVRLDFNISFFFFFF